MRKGKIPRHRNDNVNGVSAFQVRNQDDITENKVSEVSSKTSISNEEPIFVLLTEQVDEDKTNLADSILLGHPVIIELDASPFIQDLDITEEIETSQNATGIQIS